MGLPCLLPPSSPTLISITRDLFCIYCCFRSSSSDSFYRVPSLFYRLFGYTQVSLDIYRYLLIHEVFLDIHGSLLICLGILFMMSNPRLRFQARAQKDKHTLTRTHATHTQNTHTYNVCLLTEWTRTKTSSLKHHARTHSHACSDCLLALPPARAVRWRWCQ